MKRKIVQVVADQTGTVTAAVADDGTLPRDTVNAWTAAKEGCDVD